MNEAQQKVAHISGKMKAVCTILVWLLPILLTLIWLDLEAAQEMGFFHRVASPTEHTGMINYAIGFSISLLVGALVIGAIYHLRNFFKLGSEGKIFTRESGASLHKFSKYLILYSFISIPTESVLGFVMTMNNPVGERLLSIALQSYDVTLIFLSFVIFAISWVFQESVAIAEENALFV